MKIGCFEKILIIIFRKEKYMITTTMVIATVAGIYWIAHIYLMR